MSRARATAAAVLGALLCQFVLAVPAYAVAEILAARCCDADCPARPDAGTPDRCCTIAAAAAGEAGLPGPAAPATLDSAAIPSTTTPPPVFVIEGIGTSRAAARAAPLFLVQRSLRL